MPKIIFYVVFLFYFINKVHCGDLDVVTDDELLNLIRTEKFVVVLFCE